jgi:hypothetical protein
MGQVCEKLAGGNQLIAGEPLMQPGYGKPGYGQPGYGQPGYGQTGYVQSGLQPCFKCNGKGFSHDSDMAHDKEANERCFFCEPCKGCGGSGAIQGTTTSVQPVGGMMPGMGGVAVQTSQALQPCFKCCGNGFCHTSDMPHDKEEGQRCFFCEDCDTCNGRGAIPGGTTMVQQMGVPGMMGGMGMPQVGMMGGMGAPVATQTTQGLMPCFKCEGRGWCHDCDMPHDKDPDEKCFFCTACCACDGSGAIQGETTTMQQMGMPGMCCPMVVQTQGLQPCFKCEGRGWCHDCDMPHDKDQDEKCFFCTDCNACGGRGAIEGGSTTVAEMGRPGFY